MPIEKLNPQATNLCDKVGFPNFRKENLKAQNTDGKFTICDI